MKLYFYVIKDLWEEKAKMVSYECEAKENPKTYKAVDNFPREYGREYGSTVKKTNIGRVIGYGNIVILTEKNADMAKGLFRKEYATRINAIKNRLKHEESILDAVNAFNRF